MKSNCNRADTSVRPYIKSNNLKRVGVDRCVDPIKIKGYGYIFRLVYILIIILLCLLIYKFVERDSLIGVIYQILPPREAALMAGMVLGEKGGLDKMTVANFRTSGVIHIMVVSGTNVMLVFKGLVEGLARWVGRKRAIGLGFGITLIYISWVGWEIPAVRAFLLMSLFYWAQILGRKFNLWRAIGLVVIIMLLADWRVILESSFYLSFVAFGAVVVNINKEKKWWSEMWNSVWVSLWISPILALLFGQISLVAPISNALILFLVEIVTLLGIGGAAVGLVVPFLGKMGLWLAYPFLKYILWVVDGLGTLGWASVEVKFNWVLLIGWYLILVYLFFLKKPSHEVDKLSR